MKNQRTCKLTDDGIAIWSTSNLKVDPRQVFSIEYEAEDHFWIRVWWGESCIMPKDKVCEVFWNETLGEYSTVCDENS